MVLCVEMDVSMTNKADFKLLITRFPLTPLRTQDDQMYPVWPFHIEPLQQSVVSQDPTVEVP